MSDLTKLRARLERTRRRLAAATDPDDRADFAATARELEAQLDALRTSSRSHDQTIGGDAEVGVAVSGDVHGDVQRGGERYQALLQVFFQAAGVTTPDDEQRELLTSYLDGLARRCDRMRLTGVVDWERKRGKAPAFTLSQLYVTLATTTRTVLELSDTADAFTDAVAAGDPEHVLPQDTRFSGTLDGSNLRSTMGERTFTLERPRLVAEALSNKRQLVLLGSPGSGKSTFLRHLTVALATAENEASLDIPGWSAGLPLPIYASLGGFAAWAQTQNVIPDTATLWRYVLTQSEGIALDGLAAQIRRAYRQGSLLLMFDGLDEVADPALRARVASAVAGLGQTGLVIITCRVRSYSGEVAKTLDDWGESYELAPFSGGQVKHFVRGWYGRGAEQRALTEQEAAARSEQLIERIDALPTLRDLAQTPLLLTIITILHYYEGKLPEDRADLYEDMTQLLLTRWTAARREAGTPPSLLEQLAVAGMRDYHLRNLLEDLAYRAHQGEQSPDGRGLLEEGIVRNELIKLFRQFDLGHGPAAEKAEQVLRYLEDESGLLLHEGGERYGLPHLTYEEYLAGCALVKQETRFQTIAYAHWQRDPSRWREVIFLALGRMVRTDKRESAAYWLQFLLMPAHGQRTRAEPERQQAALFAAECLYDIGGKAALIGASAVDLAGLWRALAQGLAGALSATVLPAAERVRAGELLCLLELEDPRHGVCTLPPAMVPVEGDTFVIGETKAVAQFDHEVNDQEITLATFELGRFPITNAQYALFLANDGYNPDKLWWGDGGRVWLRRNDTNTPGLEPWERRSVKHQPEYWNDPRFGIARPNHPVVGISWYEAVAFCRWLTQHPVHNADGYNYYLPSEAEWEYAARGIARRPYPWGVELPDYERANFNEIYKGTTAVGCFSKGATPDVAVEDLAGNVWEWTGSIYAPYPYNPNDGREDDRGFAEKRFTLRGGGWSFRPILLRSSNRSIKPPDLYNNDIGFRLARHPSKR